MYQQHLLDQVYERASKREESVVHVQRLMRAFVVRKRLRDAVGDSKATTDMEVRPDKLTIRSVYVAQKLPAVLSTSSKEEVVGRWHSSIVVVTAGRLIIKPADYTR
eukprot:GHVS01054716.1.p2 GENE.GHVS01054716.1~~GHVS01054716.1.p2  ORF type:complete len:106 (-),score=13.58 GHVS01054716.1:110-427(-)